MEKLDYNIYIDERKELIKYEQAKYDSYEKTVLTLCAALLAFSVSFVGLLKRRTETGGETIAIISPRILVWSWVFFVSSILFILIGFFASVMVYRKEAAKIGKALENIEALNEKNHWQSLEYVLYFLSSLTFILGVIFLLVFCATNIRIS